MTLIGTVSQVLSPCFQQPASFVASRFRADDVTPRRYTGSYDAKINRYSEISGFVDKEQVKYRRYSVYRARD